MFLSYFMFAAVIGLVSHPVASQEERPEEEVQQEQAGAGQASEELVNQAQELLLQDFGSGLRALGALLAEQNPDLDMKEIWAAAEEAMQNESSDEGLEFYLASYEADQQQDDVLSFRNELRDSVIDGSMSRDEALQVWLEVMDVRFFHDFGNETNTEWAQRFKDALGTGNLAAVMLRVPDAGDVRVLGKPEFLRRDLQFFTRELELDDESQALVRVLLDDYVTRYERQSAELQKAIRAVRSNRKRIQNRERLARAQSDLNEILQSVDLQELRTQIDIDMEESTRKDWFRSAIDRFDGSVDEIQAALWARSVALNEPPEEELDDSTLLQLANQLRVDRQRMRDSFLDGMQIALDEKQMAVFSRIIDEFLLAEARIDGKFGGSKIDLETALDEAVQDDAVKESMQESLARSQAQLVELVKQWTAARISRELSGLELFVAYQEDDAENRKRLTQKHAQRARAELNTAIALRDHLLAGYTEMGSALAATDQQMADQFVEAVRAQGFQAQMRPRWSERALGAALACVDLTDEQRESLRDIKAEVSSQLTALRAQAIQDRILIEPKIARAKINAMTGLEKQSSLGLSAWQEPGARAFGALDEQVQGHMDALLIEVSCAEPLPRRRGAGIATGRGRNR